MLLKAGNVLIRPLAESDLEDADTVMRTAFGTYLGLPDPLTFMGDADYVKTRFAANPAGAIAAEVEGELVGSNFLMDWGSVGVFGPLTVRPEYWGKGVANKLMEETVRVFAKWGTTHLGLFTFAESSKHVHLYQKFGFWPRFLTAVMSKPVGATNSAGRYLQFSASSGSEQAEILESCRALCNRLYPGLDLKKEILAVRDHRLGDTILLGSDAGIEGFAICHSGAGTEAGSGNCYVKFAAVNPGAANFDSMLDACEQYACSSNSSRLTAGANAARHKQYRRMAERGFKTQMQGVAMQSPNEPGYNTEDSWIIDDWR